MRIAVVDAGTIARHLDARRVIGSVVYPAAVLEAPGVARVVEGNRYARGEPDGSTSERATRLSETPIAAGFKAPMIGDVGSEIWLKL